MSPKLDFQTLFHVDTIALILRIILVHLGIIVLDFKNASYDEKLIKYMYKIRGYFKKTFLRKWEFIENRALHIFT